MALDLPIKVEKISATDLSEFPHKVVHSIGCFSQDWRDANKWLTEHVGIRGKKWEWRSSDTFHFKNKNDAVLFSLNWTS